MGRTREGRTSRDSGETKRRGVRACRAKLEHALADSDLEKKTQIALANRIADQEELDAAPRDLVSRVFREQRVDARSIERVARALGVPAVSLYRDGSRKRDAPGHRRPRHYPAYLIPALAALAAILAILAGLRALQDVPAIAAAGCSVREALQTATTPTDRLGVVVARIHGDPEGLAHALLVRALRGDPALSPYLAVFRSCRRFNPEGVGAIEEQVSDIRERARRVLLNSDAQILIWGSVRDGKMLLRFVSNRTGLARATLNVAGRSVRV